MRCFADAADVSDVAGGGAGTEGEGMTNRLYVVATPIGNLSDLSERAVQTLREVDVVACEDTRVSRVLLRHIGSGAKTISAHEHNQRKAADAVVSHLQAGRSVALVSDAGTPAISDPGTLIVAAVHDAGFPVVPIPGPSAVAALLSCSGLSDAPFLFEGFLPARPKARDARLASVQAATDAIGAIVVLYEAPHRIEATLEALAQRYGAARRIAIGRELTKTFEEIFRGLALDAPGWLEARPERIRGEFVIAIDRVGETPADAPAVAHRTFEPDALLARLLQDLAPSRAVKLAQELTGLAHRDLYARALSMSAQAGASDAREDSDD